MSFSATSIETRIVCKAGKVALNGLNTALHGISNGSSGSEIIESTLSSMKSSFLLQGALLCVDGYNGYFSEIVLSQRILDGAGYGSIQIVTTAIIRVCVNLWRNNDEIWDKIYE